MFGISLPSISDVKNAVTGAASTALHTTEDLGSAAVSRATSLGREGLDLGRSVVNTASHIDIQKVGSTVTGAIGKAETWAENGIRTGVMDAGKGVHAGADFARSHITGNDPLSRLARGGITAAEDVTRFQLGVVGGVGNAAVGLVGSVGQLSVMAAEYQYSPSARAAINDKIVGGVESGAKAVGDYAQSVAENPSRVGGDIAGVAKAGAGWVSGEVKSAQQAIKDGHGPESFGMQVGNVATYLIPVGGEVRAAAGIGEVATRGLAGALAEDGTRALVETGAKTTVEAGAKTTVEAGAKTTVEAGGKAVAETGGKSVADGGASAATRAAPKVTDADIAALRSRLGVAETQTVAVAKTNIPGLEGKVFEGASPKVLKEAGLPPAEPGPIASPSTVPLFNRHAEEVVGNQLSRAIDGLGLKGSELEGRSVSIHVSQEVCSVCKSGLANVDKPAGVLRQLSERYPGLRIEVTATGVDKPIILQDGRRLAQ